MESFLKSSKAVTPQALARAPSSDCQNKRMRRSVWVARLASGGGVQGEPMTEAVLMNIFSEKQNEAMIFTPAVTEKRTSYPPSQSRKTIFRQTAGTLPKAKGNAREKWPNSSSEHIRDIFTYEFRHNNGV